MWRSLPKNLHQPVLNNRQLEALAPDNGKQALSSPLAHLFQAPTRDVAVDTWSTAHLKELLVAYGVNPSLFSDKDELVRAVRAHCLGEIATSPKDLEKTQEVQAVIFLSVEGVLSHASGTERLDPESLRCLKELLRSSGAHLVLSCNWRVSLGLRRKLLRALEESGIALSSIAGDTPQLEDTVEVSAKEVCAWLQAHPSVKHWAALDAADSAAFSLALEEHVVKVNYEFGLTETVAKEALQILSKLWSPEKLN